MASDQNHRSQSLMARVQEAAEQGARLHTDIVREFLDDLQVRFPATIGLLGGLVGTLIGLVIGTTLLVVTVRSRALRADAHETIVCAWLSVTALAGASAQRSLRLVVGRSTCRPGHAPTDRVGGAGGVGEAAAAGNRSPGRRLEERLYRLPVQPSSTSPGGASWRRSS